MSNLNRRDAMKAAAAAIIAAPLVKLPEPIVTGPILTGIPPGYTGVVTVVDSCHPDNLIASIHYEDGIMTDIVHGA